MNRSSNPQLKTIALNLLDYCQSNDWAGYDPYDALNSALFKRLPFLDSRFPRLALTQLLKRSPINFRQLLMIPKTQNPKALALFLMAFLKLSKLGLLKDKNLIPLMVQKLVDLRSLNTLTPHTPHPYYCWGYSFPWQTRTIIVPKGAPNLVCTVFVANALLDLYESGLSSSTSFVSDSSASGDSFDPLPTRNSQLATRNNLLFIATSAAEYILNELYWEDKNGTAGFSYPLPSLKVQVHNANFLAAALFCRIYKHSGDKKFLEPALKAARYSAKMQHPDGSWDYGENATQHWVDNFHTGYNLGALRTISHYLDTKEFEPHIRRGFEFYKINFFTEDAIPRYFHNKTYPIDIHSVAQSIITLIEFRDLNEDNLKLAYRILEWAIANMWDEREYFYYQVTPYYKNKISYMRWSQAWAILALATLLETEKA